MEDTLSRSEREREQYDQGLKRDRYNLILAHTRHYYNLRRIELVRQALQFANGKDALELGSYIWLRWIENLGIRPRHLQCINISERELDLGRSQAERTTVKPSFSLMDANNLEFEDASFDVVFGGAILHHLDFEQAVREVDRVLRPGGRIVFVEPLATNPVAKLVRWMTPAARTVDEQPLRHRELRFLKSQFDLNLHHEELLSVPAGVLSGLLFKRPDNPLMHSAYVVDRTVDRILPPIRSLFRSVLIVGNKGR